MTNLEKSPKMAMAEEKHLPRFPKGAEADGPLLPKSQSGPQHPRRHGVFRNVDVVLDGERVVKLKPVFGYLHRTTRRSRRHHLPGFDPYTDRLAYFCSMTNTGILPRRRKTGRTARAGARRYLRVILAS